VTRHGSKKESCKKEESHQEKEKGLVFFKELFPIDFGFIRTHIEFGNNGLTC
jgi:hypothetical protein